MKRLEEVASAKRRRDLARGHAEHAGEFTVDVNFDGRIIKLLLELQIPQ